MSATVVLVHGAFAGSWIWSAVLEAMDERGVRATAVDLPSCAATAPVLDFRDDAAHLRDVIAQIEGPVVVAGSSYGGAVITEAGVGDRLVYVAAFMPDAGEPVLQLFSESSYPEFSEAIAFTDTGLLTLDIETELVRAFQQAPPEQVELVRSNPPKPMSFGSDMALTVTDPAWRRIPSTYVVCTEDLSLRPEVQRQWAKERATDYVEWPSDHCPQCSRPGDVADLLAKLAKDIA